MNIFDDMDSDDRAFVLGIFAVSVVLISSFLCVTVCVVVHILNR